MLRRQARARDGNPACRAQHDGFCARLYQAHDVGVQADGGHGHHDEELAERFERRENGRIDARGAGARGHQGGAHEQHDERGQRAFQAETAGESRIRAVLRCLLAFARGNHSASANVMGMMASVRVSLTMVA